jgi:hypothetical protein
MNQPYTLRCVLLLAACGLARPAFARSGGELAISFIDAETKAPLAVRVEVATANGRPMVRKSLGTLTPDRQLYVDGAATWQLPVGQYRFTIDAGPEYRTQQGSLEIEPFASDEKVVELTRFANLAEEGWYAADTDVQLPAKVLDVARRATQEPFVPARERKGIKCVAIDDWDLPLLVAVGLVDAVEVLTTEGSAKSPSEGLSFTVDRKTFMGAQGLGRWRESMYFHLLNAGVRVPVLAGSGAGRTGAPLISSCVYAFAPAKPTESEWWDAALAGRTVVTNGPLLRPSANGQPPGYVFSIAKGDELEVAIGLNLATRTPVEYLEIIQNGEVLSATPLAAWAKNKGKLPVLTFKESGWFAVRAVTTDPKKYQLALSAPWYVEVDSKPFISKRSVQFFLDWLEHRRKKSPGNADRYTRAESFWRGRLGEANAD